MIEIEHTSTVASVVRQPYASELGGDTLPASAATPGVVIATAPGGPVDVEYGFINTRSTAMGPGDSDWWRLDVVAGETYTVNVRRAVAEGGAGAPLDGPAAISIVNAFGSIVAPRTIGIDTATLTFTAPSSGSLYITIEGGPGAGGGYSVSAVGTPAPPEIPGNVSTPETIAIGGDATGHVETAGDQDWYRVELTAGVLYDFRLVSTVASEGYDPLLELRDGAGRLIDLNDDDLSGARTLNSHVTYLAPTSGVYYLAAAGFEGSTGRYGLSTSIGTYNDLRGTIDWGTQLSSTTVDVYFIPAGQTAEGATTLEWNAYEISRAMAALATFEAVTPLRFNIVTDPVGAEFRLAVVQRLDEGTLGQFRPPGEPDAGLGVFSRSGSGWDEAGSGGLESGGLGFATLIHEFGHGLGLDHTHDAGGDTSTVMLGVNQAFRSYGLFGLNQGVFTIMSYNDGLLLPSGGSTSRPGSGNQSTPMALDIAVLQAKYGAKAGQQPGDDTYFLPEGGPGGYYSIWDTGGVDTVAFQGFANTVIDLRPATLDYSPTGGGVLSRSVNASAGFTIAAGVVIENARGGVLSDQITGNAVANRLSGGFGGDRLDGREGDDLLEGEGGDDVLDGGDGLDQLLGGIGPDQLFGGVGSDTLLGEDDNDLLAGQDGDDFLDGGFGPDLLYGGAGQDRVLGGSEADALFGQDGDDVLDGGGGLDQLFGGIGQDQLYGGVDADTLLGEDANDLLAGQDGDDFIDGGRGPDLLYGGAGQDRLIGGGEADGLYGQDGDDVLDGGEGADLLLGGIGQDQLYGGVEADTLLGEDANDLLAGQDGDDFIDGGRGPDLLYGGAGRDHMIGGSEADGLYGQDGDDLIGGQDGDDFIDGGIGFDTLYGDAGRDHLIGGAEGDLLFGQDGDDLIGGQEGDDFIDGGNGFDTLYGDGGNDLIVGGGDADRLFGQDGDDVVGGQDGDDFIDGGSGSDTLYGDAGNDLIVGGASGDRLFGQEGADLMGGQDGDDLVDGGGGNDTLYGDAGADRLVGGRGFDVLFGGSGADVFDLGAFADYDVAADFNRLEGDRVALGGLRFDSLTVADVNGDGVQDSILTYAGGTFVAVGVGDLDLAGWNGLVV